MSVQKRRHGCLTAMLVMMMFINSVGALMYSIGGSALSQNIPAMTSTVIVGMVLLCLFNLICSIALFKWKKWGFWGFIFSSIVALIINLSIGIGIGQSLLGMGGIVLLFCVLHIGKENKGWSQLN